MTNSKLNPASEAISMVKAAQTNEEDIPVTPLPDPGEGGPVYDGSMNNDPMDNGSGGNGSFGDDLSSVPVIPLLQLHYLLKPWPGTHFKCFFRLSGI